MGSEDGPRTGQPQSGQPQSGQQGALFGLQEAALSDGVGYRGPTACSAAGITYRQLDYWARTGLVEPSVRPAHGSGSQRLYSFRDILLLKVVNSQAYGPDLVEVVADVTKPATTSAGPRAAAKAAAKDD